MPQKFTRLLILAVSALVIGTSSGVLSKAQAQFYVSGNAGVSTLMDSDTNSGPGLLGVSTFDDGHVFTSGGRLFGGCPSSRRRDLPSKKTIGKHLLLRV